MNSIAIVGAGAMGCLFAARLAGAAHKVTLIDIDDARLTALQSADLTLSDDAGAQSVRVEAARARDVSDPVDLVIIFTKAMHTANAARSVAHLAETGAYALSLQNGLGNGEAIAATFAAEKVLIGATDYPADLLDFTHVASHGEGHVWLGPLTPNDASLEAARRVSQAFSGAGLDASLEPSIEQIIWRKAAFNAALNAMATVANLPVGALNAPAGRAIAAAVVDETVAVAAAQAIALERSDLMAKIDFALAEHGGHIPSMLQDHRAGRATEIENINGAIERAGQAAGIATPVTSTLANLVRLVSAAANKET